MRNYPEIPAGLATGLLVFGCGTDSGDNDGKYLAEAGLRCTVVENIQDRIDAMVQVYPTWEYINEDAFAFLDAALTSGRRWDVVSVDPYENEEAAALCRIYDWERLANNLIVIGAKHVNVVDVPWAKTWRNRDWCWIHKLV